MDERQEFLNHIAEAPTQEDRWVRMQVYADWLEEHGDPTSKGWRKVAEEKASPFKCDGSGPHISKEEWGFSDESKEDMSQGRIRKERFRELRKLGMTHNNYWVIYIWWPTRIEAEQALAKVLSDE